MATETKSSRRAAFVAGATGYTGRYVVEALAERGLRTTAHVRPDSPRLDFWTQRFEGLGATVDSTPWETEAMTATLARVRPDFVFILIGTTAARMRRVAKSGGAASDTDYGAVDFGLTKLLCNAASAAGVETRIVYLSAMGASSGARSPYGRARWAAEEAVRACGLPHLIARPAFISGSDRDEARMGERVAASVLDAGLAVPALVGWKTPFRRYGSMTGEQLARGLVAAALAAVGSSVVVEAGGLRGH